MSLCKIVLEGQSLVIAGEGAKPVGLRHLVELHDGGAHVTAAQFGPGLGQPVHERPRAAVLGKLAQDAGIVFLGAQLGHADHLSGLAALALFGQLFGQGDGPLHVAQRQVGQDAQFEQFGIFRIIDDGATVMLGRRLEIAGHAGVARGQVVARKSRSLCHGRTAQNQRQSGAAQQCLCPIAQFPCLLPDHDWQSVSFAR